jgi:protein TonB
MAKPKLKVRLAVPQPKPEPKPHVAPAQAKAHTVRSRRRRTRLIAVAASGLAVCVLGVGAVALIRGLIGGAPPVTKTVVQEIHVIRPPPPPPDVPPPPPPPPEEKVDVPDPQERPDPAPSNEPPPSEQLGLDTQGGAGGDAFGLVGNKGGRDLLGSGGSAYAWYTGLLKNEILDTLETEKRVRSGGYSVLVRVWVREDGTIDHVHIVQSSGDRERDRVIETALSRITRLSQAPPPDMPEPISLRIVSRG